MLCLRNLIQWFLSKASKVNRVSALFFHIKDYFHMLVIYFLETFKSVYKSLILFGFCIYFKEWIGTLNTWMVNIPTEIEILFKFFRQKLYVFFRILSNMLIKLTCSILKLINNCSFTFGLILLNSLYDSGLNVHPFNRLFT
jgi:hypothetical protein